MEIPGAKKARTMLTASGGGGPSTVGRPQPADSAEPTSSADTMTSKDYYFDSYSHFGKVVGWLVGYEF